jgi:signal transduction histidine kinase/ribosome recycling factor
MLQLKETINTMVDRLRAFSSEVTRVAREVGTEGKLGGQAQVKGLAGTWKDLTDSVNSMAGNLTAQVRNIAEVTTAVANGDLSRKITVDVKGEILQLKQTINTMVDQLRSFAAEVTRVAWEVGTEGKLGGQAQVPGVAGTWKDLTDSVNSMAGNLTAQVRNIAEVTTAVANGELSKKITVSVKGEMLQLKDTINTMVERLRSFAAEVTRVAREVGTEGNLGGAADVQALSGTWRDLTDSVNFMAANLTSQVRNIAAVTTAVANGDLTRKITVDVKGEVLELKSTINSMVDRLSAFADQVSRVAYEVGVEGKLGGQARILDAAGIWKDLTENVNLLAANLTAQVRGIAEVATAVAQGDVNRFIELDARGEVAALSDSINQMIRNLRETTLKLEQRVAALTEVNRELEAFSYSISHDLRAPLRSMSGFAQALLDQQRERLDAEGLDYARRISRSAQYMDRLLQDLLSYSRLTRVDISLDVVDLDQVTQQVLSVLEPEIHKHNGNVHVRSPLGTALAHEATLKQILTNLIDNAIKFAAPDRSLDLRIFSSAKPGFIRVWVEDNGIGIAREYYDKIFGLFQRLHTAEKYPGTGVGLAVVRKGAERMGGNSGLESQPGQGSRFWFELPTASSMPNG